MLLFIQGHRGDIEAVAGIVRLAQLAGLLPSAAGENGRASSLRPPAGQIRAAGKHPERVVGRQVRVSLDQGLITHRASVFRRVDADPTSATGAVTRSCSESREAAPAGSGAQASSSPRAAAVVSTTRAA